MPRQLRRKQTTIVQSPDISYLEFKTQKSKQYVLNLNFIAQSRESVLQTKEFSVRKYIGRGDAHILLLTVYCAVDL